MKSSIAKTSLLPLLLAVSGCGYNQVQAQNSTPIPQSLIMAAERASQSSMAMRDMMARSHGQSVRDIELELPDEHIPDFLLQEVRIDYNGPMEQVLARVSHDIGYRVVEYNEPSSGISWQPWIRLDGNKPLIQHFKEMNSQIPWHLILDHRSGRIVLDYAEDGSIARQVQRAQASLNRNEATLGVRSLPDTSSMRESADQQVSANVIPGAEGPARQASASLTPQSQSSIQAPAEQAGYWYAGIRGYQSGERAEDMVAWLSANDFTAHSQQIGSGEYEVRVRANSDVEAQNHKAELEAKGVPSKVFYYEPSAYGSLDEQNISPRAHSFSSSAPEQEITAQSITKELIESAWYVQIAYTTNDQAAQQVIGQASLSRIPEAYKIGRGWAVRMGPLDNRQQALRLMSEARANGFSDAYPVKGSAI